MNQKPCRADFQNEMRNWVQRKDVKCDLKDQAVPDICKYQENIKLEIKLTSFNKYNLLTFFEK